MSAHFTYYQLYSAIKNNDLAALKKGVFFLGPRIHVVHVWCGRTAMEYAARLGQLEQAKLLFTDLERYHDQNYGPRHHVRNFFGELVKHRDKDTDFIRRLINDRYDEEWGSQVDVMVIEGAYELLEILAKRDPERYMSKIVAASFYHTKPEILQVEWFQQNSAFQNELRAWFEEDPLQLAIMEKNHKEVGRLIISETSEFPSMREDNYVKVKRLPKVGVKREADESVFSAYYAIFSVQFLHSAIKVDSVNILHTLMNGNVLRRLVELMKSSEEMIFDTVFSIAIYSESLNVVRAMLAHSGFRRDRIDWHLLYYELLVAGKEKSAHLISPLRGGYMLQQTKDRLYQTLGNDRPAMRFMEPDAAESLIYQVVDAVESFPTDKPRMSSQCQWRGWLRSFPWSHGRPDLAVHFSKYGFTDSENDIIDMMAAKSCPDVAQSFTTSQVERLPTLFLSEVHRHYEISPDHKLDDHERIELVKCVEQTGKKMKVLKSKTQTPCTVYSYKFHWHSKYGHYEVNSADRKTFKNFIRTTESKRFKALTLQKLCRTQIRSIHINNQEMNLEDSILSLYVYSLLPKHLVNFLLYRDEDMHQPLFYQLVKPQYTHVHPGRHGLYDDSPLPVQNTDSDESDSDLETI